MFPDVDPAFVDQQYDRFQNLNWEDIINNVCNILLENPQYPKKQTQTSLPISTKVCTSVILSLYRQTCLTVHSRTHCGGSPSETDCLSCLTWSLQVFVDYTPDV